MGHFYQPHKALRASRKPGQKASKSQGEGTGAVRCCLLDTHPSALPCHLAADLVVCTRASQQVQPGFQWHIVGCLGGMGAELEEGMGGELQEGTLKIHCIRI